MKLLYTLLFLWSFFASNMLGQETEHLTFTSAYEGENKINSPYETYVLQDNGISFDFYVNIAFTDNFEVTVSDGTSTETYTSSNNPCQIKKAALMRLFVPLALYYGKTYNITIAKGSLCAAENSSIVNEEVTFQVVSTNAYASIELSTPYKKEASPVTSRIILTASAPVEAVNHKTYSATLTGTKEGEESDCYENLVGYPNLNQIVFTPTQSRPLKAGYTYTLTLEGEGAEINNNVGAYFPQKNFTFTTEVPSGNAPTLTSTMPTEESTVAYGEVQPADVHQIMAEFAEDIQLIDGATAICRPVGGSEGISVKHFTEDNEDAENGSENQNTLFANGNKLYFNYSGDNLFYGLRYEVIIPTHSVVGKEGMPMEKDLRFYFNTAKQTKATDNRERQDVYTWDFTNISDNSWNKLQEAVDANATFWGKGTVNNRNAFGSFNAPKSDKKRFNQDQEIILGDGSVMPELKGLLFNLVNNRSNRFCICPANGTDNSYIDMTGGTHYMTLQNVPTGSTIFVEHTDQFFNLNSVNVDSLRTYMNDQRHNVSMYKVKEKGDVSFCFQNLKLYRVAIVKDYKSIGNEEKQFKYSTYSQLYPVDFKLNTYLSDKGSVTAYKVSNTYTSDATYINFTEMPDNLLAIGDGAILTADKLGSISSHPIFTTDINALACNQEDNALVATNNGINFTEAENGQNYILTYQYFNIFDENKDIVEGDQQCFYKWIAEGIGPNLAYLHLENPYNTTAKSVIYLNWYNPTVTKVQTSQNREGKVRQTGVYYAIDGRQVSTPSEKGVYIYQGKKYVVK